MAVAYVLSLVFAVAYGYIAAHNRRVEMAMIAVLDILQSIPVLSFLPGVMLAMVALFPTRQLGVELGSIVLIFTGQVWNMAFSFYSSLQIHSARSARGGAHQPLQRHAALRRTGAAVRHDRPGVELDRIGGGRVVLPDGVRDVRAGNHDFRLPGLGSYLQTAASAGDTAGIVWGLAAMIAVIVLLDQLLWRPAIAWSEKFKMEQVESAAEVTSPILHLLRNSDASRWIETARHRSALGTADRQPAPRRSGESHARDASRPLRGRRGAAALALAVPYLLVKAALDAARPARRGTGR
jgi:NitT/TauT family transport system permease protein